MSEAVVDDIVAVLPPLLQALEALAFIARHLDPPEFAAVMQAIGRPDAALAAARPRLEDWPPRFADIQDALDDASAAVLKAFAGLRAAQNGEGDLVAVFRALRHGARAEEALYKLAARLPPVSDFFLEPALAADADLKARLAAPAQPDTGFFHIDNEPGQRGGFSLYVPEYYTPDRAWPLVMALHGGSGHGRSFLWNWLREARSHGAILVAPTATGKSWALMGNDADSPNLMRMMDIVQQRWNIAPTQRLLTGMSDGGTFCYVSGLQRTSPFTHLAPVAATFHPVLIAAADAERCLGLPVFLVHGQLDWMFPVETARHARQALAAAGAAIHYREFLDLSHAYPREINGAMLRWLRGER